MPTSSAPATPSAALPTATAAAPASPPLPDELWLKILKELNYSGLQKAGQLCKKFKGFLQVRRARLVRAQATVGTSLTRRTLLARRIPRSTTPCSAPSRPRSSSSA